MKKLTPFPRQFNMLIVLAALMLILPASFIAAQVEAPAEEAPAEGATPVIKRIVGTWKIDFEQTEEVMSEKNFKMMSRVRDSGVSMVFSDAGQFTMKIGVKAEHENVSYTISAVEGEENLYSVVVQRPGNVQNAKVLFTDANTIKFMPEGEEPAILVRVVEEEAEAEEGEAEEEAEDE